MIFFFFFYIFFTEKVFENLNGALSIFTSAFRFLNRYVKQRYHYTLGVTVKGVIS